MVVSVFTVQCLVVVCLVVVCLVVVAYRIGKWTGGSKKENENEVLLKEAINIWLHGEALVEDLCKATRIECIESIQKMNEVLMI